ncbi:amidohydrolase family protein [Paraburkholderia sp. ZP32-5]|uniref:amidohydrolase family protein n=1 Tax=Paraburkholderia sp. ZP32-5 TaxID=2883245 RepID=UPI001F3D5D5F|nr:amidohydrolase family protein [Paraburkholderia sp. ZP32-5]
MLPPGACDAHCHIFGPGERFPYAAQRSYTPADAPYETLAALHRELGIARAVIVQGACHGHDHAALLDALARSGGAYRGVALLVPEASDADVRALHEGGVRGARFNFVAHLGGAPSLDAFRNAVERIVPLGWHVCIHTDITALKSWLPHLASLPVPFVIDHMARVDASKGVDHADFRLLQEVAKLDHAWVKISGVDRISRSGAPFAEGVACMRALIEANPARILWGTDWPHPNVAGAVPREPDLLDALFAACPDDSVRQRVLVDNPARLYDFA